MTTTDRLISAAISAMASESASPEKAGATGASRVMLISFDFLLLALRLALTDGHTHVARFAAADDTNGDRPSDPIACEALLELFDLANFISIDGDDDVSEHQTGRFRRTPILDRNDQQTVLLTVVEGAGECVR